ncbi:hypothetical protein [Klebsiella pneumoniae]|uniref:hypothetical protein n=1 Tax=Klebsiella pneumoniae TaxID=573 RepID=UPI003D6E984F
MLVTSNIRDGELRKLSTWTAHKEAVALVDNVYHRISKVDKDNQLITLTDSEGKERLSHPGRHRQKASRSIVRKRSPCLRGTECASAKVTLERGYVANSIWEVQSVWVTVSRYLMANSPVR